MLKGWKTTIFNVLVVVIAGIEAGTYNDLIPDNYEATLLAIVGAINLVLRALTNTPIGSKD